MAGDGYPSPIIARALSKPVDSRKQFMLTPALSAPPTAAPSKRLLLGQLDLFELDFDQSPAK